MRIRALGVSLVVIAAVVASLTVLKLRNEENRPEPLYPGGKAPAALDPFNLDEIRSAGF